MIIKFIILIKNFKVIAKQTDETFIINKPIKLTIFRNRIQNRLI